NVATISKKLSASLARVSHTCHESKIKSFRRTGSFTLFRASRRFLSEPRKNSGSVRTERAAAPTLSSDAARPTGSNGSRSSPRLGEAGLSSAITLIPGPESALIRSRNGEAAWTPYLSAVDLVCRLLLEKKNATLPEAGNERPARLISI